MGILSRANSSSGGVFKYQQMDLNFLPRLCDMQTIFRVFILL